MSLASHCTATFNARISYITNIIECTGLTIVGSLGEKINGRAKVHIEATAGECCTMLGCAGSNKMKRRGKRKSQSREV
jgi:hypothetical protein